MPVFYAGYSHQLLSFPMESHRVPIQRPFNTGISVITECEFYFPDIVQVQSLNITRSLIVGFNPDSHLHLTITHIEPVPFCQNLSRNGGEGKVTKGVRSCLGVSKNCPRLPGCVLKRPRLPGCVLKRPRLPGFVFK